MSDESPEVSEAMEKFYEDWWDRQRRGEDADEIQAKKIQDQMTETESLRKTITELEKRADDAEAKLSTAENIVGQLRDQQAKVRADWTLLSEKHGHAKDYHSILVRTHDEAMSRADEWEAYAEGCREAITEMESFILKADNTEARRAIPSNLILGMRLALAQSPKSSLARRDAEVRKKVYLGLVKAYRNPGLKIFHNTRGASDVARDLELMIAELDKGGE